MCCPKLEKNIINLHYWHHYVNLSNTTLLRLLMKQSKYYFSNIFSIQYAEQKLILTILLFTPLTSGYFSVLVLQPRDFSIWVLFFYYIYIPSMSWVVKTLELRMVKNHAFILVENNTGFYFTLATRNQKSNFTLTLLNFCGKFYQNRLS